MANSSMKLFKSVVNFKFMENFSCFQVFCQVEHFQFLYWWIRLTSIKEKREIDSAFDLLYSFRSGRRCPKCRKQSNILGLEASSALKKKKAAASQRVDSIVLPGENSKC